MRDKWGKKMLDSRKTNSNCGLAETIVSYVYDEMAGPEKHDFERHLSSCLDCENELAAFSSVSSSVKEWRDAEFAVLETPEISIPYKTQDTAVMAADASDSNPSWLENMRGLISSFGMKTVAGFASLAVVLGLGWFLVNSFSSEQDIAKEPGNKVIEPIGGKENLSPAKPDPGDVVEENESEINSPNVIPEVSPELAADNASPTDARKTAPTKATYRAPAALNRNISTRRNSNKNRSRAKKPNPSVKEKTNPVIQAPIDRLTEEFAIDEKKEDELRLSDLFDEVGSDK